MNNQRAFEASRRHFSGSSTRLNRRRISFGAASLLTRARASAATAIEISKEGHSYFPGRAEVSARREEGRFVAAKTMNWVHP